MYVFEFFSFLSIFSPCIYAFLIRLGYDKNKKYLHLFLF